MRYIACLYADKIFFGSYPEKFVTEKDISAHRKSDDSSGEPEALVIPFIDIFVNLTESKYDPIPGSTHLHFPIEDEGVPSDEAAFDILLCGLIRSVKEGKRIYIHCEHGRGRTGVVAVCLISYLLDLFYEEAQHYVTKIFRSVQPVGSSWKKKSIPCHEDQEDFCERFLQRLGSTETRGEASAAQKLSLPAREHYFTEIEEINTLARNLATLQADRMIVLIIEFAGNIEGIGIGADGETYVIDFAELNRLEVTSVPLKMLLGEDRQIFISGDSDSLTDLGYKMVCPIDIEELARPLGFQTATFPEFSRSLLGSEEANFEPFSMNTRKFSRITRRIDLYKRMLDVLLRQSESPASLQFSRNDLIGIQSLKVGAAEEYLIEKSTTFGKIPPLLRKEAVGNAFLRALKEGQIEVIGGIVKSK